MTNLFELSRKVFFVIAVACLLAGCASSSDAKSPAATTQPMAECPVCKANADLACVDVVVDSHTPCCQMHGKTTYFCSDECKAKYVAHPERYPAQ